MAGLVRDLTIKQVAGWTFVISFNPVWVAHSTQLIGGY